MPAVRRTHFENAVVESGVLTANGFSYPLAGVSSVAVVQNQQKTFGREVTGWSIVAVGAICFLCGLLITDHWGRKIEGPVPCGAMLFGVVLAIVGLLLSNSGRSVYGVLVTFSSGDQITIWLSSVGECAALHDEILRGANLKQIVSVNVDARQVHIHKQ